MNKLQSKSNESLESASASSSSASPDPAVKEQARDLYLDRHPKSSICRAVGVTHRTLTKWVKDGGWDLEREDADRSLIDDNFSARRITVATIARKSADEILRAVEAITQRPDPPTLNEAEKLSTILSALDKIGRLDANKSTENLAVNVAGTVAMTAAEIRKALTEDPFFTTAAPQPDDDTSDS